MKKVLILSYHALPMDVVSSYRTKGFCDHLASCGVYPTLLTHRWERDINGSWKFHETNDKELIERSERLTTIRLPRRRVTVGNSKIVTFSNYLHGIFESELIGSYEVFRQFLLKHLINHKYDAILTIYSPHFQMKVAHEMKVVFGIPYITDFRDLWDNQIVTKSYKPSFKKRIIDLVIGYWWNKWIKDAVFFTTTGDHWKDWLEKLSGRKRGYVIRNGFEENINKVISQPIIADEFLIVHFGKLYPNQDLSVFIQGFESFLTKGEAKIKLLIIGHKPRHGVAIEKLLAKLPGHVWEIRPYMGKAELFNYCINKVSVLWMPGFIEDNGQFPVKVYDYLSMAKNILFAPRNNSDVQHVIEETRAGVVCDSAIEVSEQLSTWYESFITNGFLTYFGNEKVIMRYTRVNQVKILAEKIHEYIR